jgi:hypothetical protein
MRIPVHSRRVVQDAQSQVIVSFILAVSTLASALSNDPFKLEERQSSSTSVHIPLVDIGY